MNPSTFPAGVAAALAGVINAGKPLDTVQWLGGCSGTACWRVMAGGRSSFVKCAADAAARFTAEVDGLAALAACQAWRVPAVLACGSAVGTDYLALEWLELGSDGDSARLGEALAALHDLRQEGFGWGRDNFIGATPQCNSRRGDAATFYRDCRLLPQLRRAAARGFPELLAPGERLAGCLDHAFGEAVTPVLVHGDLWHGNCGFVAGQPCFFDPAIHAGDAESDLAMAELFGGFAPDFLAAYRTHHPELPGAAQRRALYRLYHLLNHVNLFGAAYLAQSLGLLRQLRAELA